MSCKVFKKLLKTVNLVVSSPKLENFTKICCIGVVLAPIGYFGAFSVPSHVINYYHFRLLAIYDNNNVNVFCRLAVEDKLDGIIIYCGYT